MKPDDFNRFHITMSLDLTGNGLKNQDARDKNY